MVQATLDQRWLPKSAVPGLFTIKRVKEMFGTLQRNNRELSYQYFVLGLEDAKGNEYDFEAKFGDKNVLIHYFGTDTDAWVAKHIEIDFNEQGYKYIKSVEMELK